MNIEELLNKYFEGETSCEEEQEIRLFFAQGLVPEHLQKYRALFGFLAEENKQYRAEQGNKTEVKLTQAVEQQAVQPTLERSIKPPRRTIFLRSWAAAAVLLLLGIAGLHYYNHSLPEDYVIIDGKQYADPDLARQQALAAFQSVSFSEEEVFANLFDE